MNPEGHIIYSYRGTNPQHPDNVGLRRAMKRGIPLIYFHSLVPGKYYATWPVYIVGDNPTALEFSVVADDKKYVDKINYNETIEELSIPDIEDQARREIVNIEGKKYEYRSRAIEKLKTFGPIENNYIKQYYPEYRIIRTIVLYGGNATEIVEIEVGFLLNKSGDLILGIKAPFLFQEAIKNLIDFWFA
jgi:hypothetical protein